MVTFTSRVKVSGVRCQRLNSTRYATVAYAMVFLAPVLTFNCNQIGVHDSGFGIY